MGLCSKVKRVGSERKPLSAELVEVVQARLRELRDRPFEHLATLPETAEETFLCQGRPASLCTWRIGRKDGSLVVLVTASRSYLGGIVQAGHSDGFTITPGGKVLELTGEERREYL